MMLQTITRPQLLLGVAVCFILSACQSAPPAKTCKNDTPPGEDGWQSLFDGQTLEGWSTYERFFGYNAGFKVELGEIHPDIGEFSGGAYLLTEQAYADYELTFEAYSEGKTPAFAIAQGSVSEESYGWRGDYVSLNIDGYRKPMFCRYFDNKNTRSPGSGATDTPTPPYNASGWNLYRIRVEGDRVRFWVNGELVGDENFHPAVTDRFERGRVGFGYGCITKGANLQFRWRNVLIRELDN